MDNIVVVKVIKIDNIYKKKIDVEETYKKNNIYNRTRILKKE